MDCNQCEYYKQHGEPCHQCGKTFKQTQFQNELAFMENGGGAFQQTHMTQNSQFEENIQGTLDMLKEELEVDYEYFESFEIAKRLLKLAFQINKKLLFLKIYAGAALYFGFRCKQAPYLLIDISDKIPQCSVIKLARCYLKLLRFLKLEENKDNILLSQNFQFIDPSIYIPKFVRALEFKDKQFQIIETAKKLVKRMMLDWISYGRRPSSICGAALLISSRFHGEKLSTATICKTVQVCDETIRKRLVEFNQTGLSQLTREQFEQIQNIETEVPGEFNDPPAFTRARIQEKEKMKMLEDPEKIKEYEEQTMKKALKMIEIIKKKPEIIQQEPKIQSPILTLDIKEKSIKRIEFNEELSALDEDEQKEFILTKEESDQKKIIWNNMYKDYLQDKEQQRQVKMNEEQQKQHLNEDQNGEPIKKKKRQNNLFQPSQAKTCEDSIIGTLKNKKQVNKESFDGMFLAPEEPTGNLMDDIFKILK